MKGKIAWAFAGALLLAISPAGAADAAKKVAQNDKPAAKPADAKAADAKTTETKDQAASGAKYKTTDERFSYMIGYQVGAQVKSMGGGNVDSKILSDGLQDGLAGKKPALSDKEIEDTMRIKREEAMKEQAEAQAEFQKLAPAAKAESEKFLKENAKKSGIKTTKSGLQYKVITEGKGKTPKPTDTVKVNYEGKLVNGKVFDSSYERGAPATFPANRVISGWTEALQMMKEGGKVELYIPSDLAYGEEGRQAPEGDVSIPPNSALIFTVELLEVMPSTEQGMPPGHPSVGGQGQPQQQQLPPGHPSVGGKEQPKEQQLPPGHPPVGGGANKGL